MKEKIRKKRKSFAIHQSQVVVRVVCAQRTRTPGLDRTSSWRWYDVHGVCLLFPPSSFSSRLFIYEKKEEKEEELPSSSCWTAALVENQQLDFLFIVVLVVVVFFYFPQVPHFFSPDIYFTIFIIKKINCWEKGKVVVVAPWPPSLPATNLLHNGPAKDGVDESRSTIVIITRAFFHSFSLW